MGNADSSYYYYGEDGDEEYRVVNKKRNNKRTILFWVFVLLAILVLWSIIESWMTPPVTQELVYLQPHPSPVVVQQNEQSRLQQYPVGATSPCASGGIEWPKDTPLSSNGRMSGNYILKVINNNLSVTLSNAPSRVIKTYACGRGNVVTGVKWQQSGNTIQIVSVNDGSVLAVWRFNNPNFSYSDVTLCFDNNSNLVLAFYRSGSGSQQWIVSNMAIRSVSC